MPLEQNSHDESVRTRTLVCAGLMLIADSFILPVTIVVALMKKMLIMCCTIFHAQ